MGTIVQLQNKVTGENQYPRTYTTAVIDENATPLSTLMEQQDDKITELATCVIFDISEYSKVDNELKTYTDLSDALTDVPADRQHGGITVRYVQTSDNKYVQYRLMANQWSTTESDWQGVDDEPTAGSDNLVNGKGVYYAVNKGSNSIGLLLPINTIDGRFVRNTGVIQNVGAGTFETNIYDVSSLAGKDIRIATNISEGDSWTIFAFLQNNDAWVNGQVIPYAGENITQDLPINVQSFNVTYTVPLTAKYLAIIHKYTFDSVAYYINASVITNNNLLGNLYYKTTNNEGNINKIATIRATGDCIYDSQVGSTGSITKNNGTFVTPLLPFTSTVLVCRNNTDVTRYLVLFTADLSETTYYTVGAHAARYVGNIDTTKWKYCRTTFAETNEECWIKENSDNSNDYLWYGYSPINKHLSNTQKNEVCASLILTGGSLLNVDRVNKTITFPATSAVLYNGALHQFSQATTISIPHNNGYIIFNPNNLATNNGIKNANYNYTFVKDDYILFAYNMIYGFFSIPIEYIVFTDESIKDYGNTKISIKDRITALTTASRVTGSIAPLVLEWFSDLHGEPERINELKRFNKELYLDNTFDDVIATGDQVAQFYTSDFDFWGTVGANNFLQVIGNHEVWDETTREYNHAGADAYQRYFAPYISGWNVQSAGTNLCYYYKDYSAKKIRLIVLDCMAYDDAQNTWFANILEDARQNNLNVVAVSHYRADEPDYIENPFTSLYRGNGATLNSLACATVQAFINNGGKFICWIGGHTHYDVVYKCHNYPEQLGIIIGCMSASQRENEHQERAGRFRNLFNLIGFDTDSKQIRIIRPCCNMDRWNRAQNTLIVNYETRQVIYND